MHAKLDMQRLVDITDESLGRGTVLCTADQSTGNVRCYMLVDLNAFGAGMALVNAAGYKAGIVYITLPDECLTKGTRMVNREWLVRNFEHRVDDEVPVESVYCMHYFPEPDVREFTNEQTT